MDEPRPNPQDLNLQGGNLSLDFVNTVDWEDWRTGPRPVEYLRGYPDLLTWGRHAGILTEQQADRLAHLAEDKPEEAARVLQEALMVRGALSLIFSAAAQDRAAEKTDLDLVNQALSRAMAHAQIIPGSDGYVWDWPEEDMSLDGVLWPVLRAAAALLVSGDLRRVRVCEGPNCGWLFLDTTKNRSRRWCSMSSCGNRAKARRHYRRIRPQSAPTAPDPPQRPGM
jgi:predicted RNA-binding Zn ribbon-like protein